MDSLISGIFIIYIAGIYACVFKPERTAVNFTIRMSKVS